MVAIGMAEDGTSALVLAGRRVDRDRAMKDWAIQRGRLYSGPLTRRL